MAETKKDSTASILLVCLALVTLTLSVYLQVGSHQFLSFDDTQYVTNNPHLSGGITGKNIIWALTSVDAFNWHPVTWLSHLADVQAFGMTPGYHHLTSVAIHSASAVLLLLLLLQCTGSLWQSSFVAALFALHPLHVESVAWIAERKDVLSAFFGFLTLSFYAGYLVKRNPGRYLLALLSFLLGLMSKPMLVTLPVVMLLMDYWPLERYRQQGQGQPARPGRLLRSLIREKIPFFACSLLSVVVTIYAQHKGGAVIGLREIPFPLRAENALVAYVKYFGKTLWPSDLAVFYPFPQVIPFWQVVGSLVLLMLASACCLWAIRRSPYLAVGWFWFLITLVPVIGLIQVGGQSMADRYMYLPAVGLFIMAAWGVPDLTRGVPHRTGILVTLAGVAIMAYSALSWKQLGYWQDGITLYRHTLEVTANNHLINYNLGVDLAGKGDWDGAIQAYRASLQGNTFNPETHNNLGFALARKGDLDAAIKEYQTALWMSPRDTKAHSNMAEALVQKGDLDAAIREYRIALSIAPDNAETCLHLGNALAGKGDLNAAAQTYREALRIHPDSSDAHNNLGAVLARRGDLDAAIGEYRAAIRIIPGNTDAHANLGIALMEQGALDSAIREFNQVLRIKPDDTLAASALERATRRRSTTGDTGK
jgi:protein O-mannosyl-transferase